jgi:uncharacterized phage-associated protein
MNNEKILNSMLFVLKNLGGKTDFHKMFKILYFADQKHLVSYGFPITGDFYVAMENGPVPSYSYDVLKTVRGDSFWSSAHPEYSKIFDVQKYFITAKKEPDMDELAESDVECMLLAIEENKTLNFGQLKEKSHQSAWNNAISNAKKDENNFDNEISFIDIAKEANADEEMLRYIVLNLENQSIFDYAEVQ